MVLLYPIFGGTGVFVVRNGSDAARAAAVLVLAAGSVPDFAWAQTPAGPNLSSGGEVSADVARTWGVLAELSGREWAVSGQSHRFVWSAENQQLAWEVRHTRSSQWIEQSRFTLTDAGVTVVHMRRNEGFSVGPDGSVSIRFTDFVGGSLTISRDGNRYRVQVRPIPARYHLSAVHDGWTGASLLDPPTTPSPRAPNAPIILAAAPDSATPARSSLPSRNASAQRPSHTHGPAALAASPVTERSGGAGPIVIAAAPPPPAAMRDSPGASTRSPAPVLASREAQMQAQVAARREQAAREAEAERIRQAELAEQRRRAEEARLAEQRRREASENEGLAFVGALLGGVVLGSSGGGSMEAVTAGMAIGANLAGPGSDIASATNNNYQAAHQEAEAQREFERQVIAEMNNPDNPLTQQARREEEARRTAAEARQAEAEAREREAREAADREALERERMADRAVEDQQHERDQQRAEEERQERERRDAEAAQRREHEAEQRRQEEEERRQEAERQQQAQEDRRRREEEARRQEEERRRAERSRMMNTGNASGGYSLASGLPPLNQSSNGPGSGTVTLNVDHIGGCRATSVTVRYSLGGLMGDPVVGGAVAWTGENGCSLPASTNAWVKVSWNGTYAWVSLGATPGSANGGFGYNSPGSPPWSRLLCGFEGARTTSCLDADSARRLWSAGTVTEVRIGW